MPQLWRNKSLNGINDTPSENACKEDLLSRVCDSILQKCFIPPDYGRILNANVKQNEEFPYCICKFDSGDDMIGCDNQKCPNGEWFHYECYNINDGDTESIEWFCSEKCRQGFLKKKGQEDCDDGVDHIFEYSQLLLWRGIGEMVRHRAIRYNNGEKIITNWKFDLVDFFDNNHTKYFLASHRLLFDTNGALSDRLAHQLIWNRTVNTVGGCDRNIEMDLQMEFFNRQFKGKLFLIEKFHYRKLYL